MAWTKGKKPWLKPELIVLVRQKPEEAVLVACKGDGFGPAVAAQHDACQNITTVCSGGCTVIAAS